MKLDFDPRKNMSMFAYCQARVRNLNILNKLNDIVIAKGLLSNWYDAIFFRLGFKKSFFMHLRDGSIERINNRNDYNKFWESEKAIGSILENRIKFKNKINLDLKNKIIKVKTNWIGKEIKFRYDDGKQAINTTDLIIETFVNEQYKNLDVKNKNVIDVGANIGDSAIYFALKGAKHVYAFEPYLYSYNLAKENIKLNGLDNIITLINEGCGKNGFVRIDSEIKNYGNNDLKNTKYGEKIVITSINSIIKKFRIKEVVLKIDCEGCEYDTIYTLYQQSVIKYGIIEYHYGYKNLIRKLKTLGFEVSYNMPRFVYNAGAENKDMYVGWVRFKKDV